MKRIYAYIIYLITHIIYSQNTDSISFKEKLSLRIGFKGIYITSSLRNTNFVRRADLLYSVNNRISVGISAFMGWRFGKNFGEDIDFDVNTKRELVSLFSTQTIPKQTDKYTLGEWFSAFGLSYTALNFKYKGIGVFAEYRLDKNGLFEIFGNRKVHIWSYLGLSYVTGEVAGNLLYIQEGYGGFGFGGNYPAAYYYVYEKIKYQDISGDIMLRLKPEAKKKDIILPSFSVYYVYAPDQVKNGMRNFGWLWDIRIILWKKK